MEDFFRATNDNVYLNFDTANLFSAARVVTEPEDALRFIQDNAQRMKYIHLKTSTKEHKAIQGLSDNELDFEIIFDLMAENGVNYVALEWGRGKTLKECFQDVDKGVQYLKGKRFIMREAR